MARAPFQRDFTDNAGNLLTSPVTVLVRREDTGTLPQLYPHFDNDDDPLGNPATFPDGRVLLHADGGFYRIEVTSGAWALDPPLRHYAIGLAAGTDLQLAVPAGAYDAEAIYQLGSLVSFSGYAFISRIDENEGNEPDASPADTDQWMYVPGTPGEGLYFDVQVDDLADRDAYDDEPPGFRVLVSDTGDGRAAVYSMGGGGSADWSDPAYATVDITFGTTAGTVTEGNDSRFTTLASGVAAASNSS